MSCSIRKAIRAMLGSRSVGGPFRILPQQRSLVVLRPLIGCLALCVVAAATRAAVVRIESDDEVLTIFQMSVTPAAEPAPALNYRLLPPELERKPGNGAPFYYRTLLQYMSVAKQLEKDHGADYLDWRSLPIDQLPLPGLRDVVKSFDSAVLGQLREATRRKACDWDFQETSWTGPKQFQFVLPELQSTRGVARILALRARLAIAEGRFDDAIESLQLGYQMAHDTSKPELMIPGLVGIAVAAEMNNQLTDFIGTPGSPNVYWALAAQPRPLVDLRPSIRFEMTGGLRALPFLIDAETAQHSAAEWSGILARSLEVLGGLSDSGPLGGQRNPWQAQLAVTALAVKAYADARRALLADGMTAEQLETMPSGQVIAIAAARAYRYMADEFEKCCYLPFWQAERRWADVEAKLRADGYLGAPLGGKEIIPIGSLVMPATHAAYAAQVRLERDLAALRVIEAIRMHAATTDGQLPPTLAAISVVPPPLNPATGQPFRYSHRDGTATLELPESDGLRIARRYEIRIRKTEE